MLVRIGAKAETQEGGSITTAARLFRQLWFINYGLSTMVYLILFAFMWCRPQTLVRYCDKRFVAMIIQRGKRKMVQPTARAAKPGNTRGDIAYASILHSL